MSWICTDSWKQQSIYYHPYFFYEKLRLRIEQLELVVLSVENPSFDILGKFWTSFQDFMVGFINW